MTARAPTARRALLPIAGLLAAWPLAAHAMPYDVEIDVETEEDLYDLAARDAISQPTLESLVELMQDGVDLNSASREELYALPNLTYAEVDAILEYRERSGRIADPEELVTAGALAADQLLHIAPFIAITVAVRAPVSGRARLMGAWANADSVAPPVFLQTSLRGPFDLKAGAALDTTRRWLGTIGYDAIRESLNAYTPGYAVHLRKAYIAWKTSGAQVIVGSFHAGFGQRLTLSSTARRGAGGFYPDDVVSLSADLSGLCRESAGEMAASPCTEAEGHTYITPDFRWPETFRGVAATLRNIQIGPARISLSGFGSYQSRSLYQYQLYDKAHCADPHDDNDPACTAPPVWVREPDPLLPAPRFSFMTLPDLFTEMAVGGNASVDSGDLHAGLTGYWATTRFAGEPMQLDFQEWARYPYGGAFGAVGVDGGVKIGPTRVLLEAARSFDHMPGAGGGFGVVERTVVSFRRQEAELSLRYYDHNFVNPYARPISANDLFEGQRARNEAGARALWTGRQISACTLTSFVDLWLLPDDSALGTSGMANLEARAQADWRGLRSWVLSGWVGYKNKDLAKNTRGLCYELTTEYDAQGVPVPCSGERRLATGRADWSAPGRRLHAAVEYSHRWVDDPAFTDRFRRDQVAWLELDGKPFPSLQLRGRLKYLQEGYSGSDPIFQTGGTTWRLATADHYLTAYLEAIWAPSRLLSAHLRYDVYRHLKQTAATLARIPNPEHRVRLELESRF